VAQAQARKKTHAPYGRLRRYRFAATIAVATSGPTPGIWLSRWQAGSEEAICSTSAFIAMICCSRSFHSLQSRLTRLRMRGVRFASTFSRIWHRQLQLGWGLRECHASLEQEGPQLVDHRCSACDQTIPHAESLQVELVVSLDREGWKALVPASHLPTLFEIPSGLQHSDGLGDEKRYFRSVLVLAELLPQQYLASCAEGQEVKGRRSKDQPQSQTQAQPPQGTRNGCVRSKV
jgi:hypothetical protein